MSDEQHALNQHQVREVQQIAELQVRRYFDHYLNDVFPEQTKALRKHTYEQVEYHDHDPKAHNGVERRFNRIFWLMVGASGAAGTGVGVGVRTLIAAAGG